MTSEQFNDPAYVPKNGAEWEAWIWLQLEARPNMTSKQVMSSHPHLSIGAASGFLSKLVKRKQVAAVKFAVTEGETPVFRYSIAVPVFEPAVRKRNVRTRPPIPPFNFDQEDPPVKLIEETARMNTETGRFAAEPARVRLQQPVGVNYQDEAKAVIAGMSAPLAKAVYTGLQELFGPLPSLPPAQAPEGPQKRSYSLTRPRNGSRELVDLFSVRVFNCLHAMSLHTLEDVAAKTKEDLLKGPNMGPVSLYHIQAVLREHGLRLAGS